MASWTRLPTRNSYTPGCLTAPLTSTVMISAASDIEGADFSSFEREADTFSGLAVELEVG